MMAYVTGTRNFTVMMKPVGKQRPRVTRRGTYTAEKTRVAEREIKTMYEALFGDYEPLRGPLHVTIFIYDTLPLSRPKRVVREAYTVKPDADNVAKLVLDALNGVAFVDDAQITELIVVKKDRKRDEVPRIEIALSNFREAV